MSDLSDLHGVYPTAIRWNAETGILGIAVYNAETGERELEEIELGKPATFAMDMATRERGYGLIKVGVYDMRLTPVGSPAPQWMDDEEFKPAIGCWLWNPNLDELRLETNASILRTAVANVWGEARLEPEFMKGLQPVVRFVDRVPVPVKSVNKTFFGPVIHVIGWTERDKVPGWRERAPTVPLPVAPTLLGASSSAPASTPATPAVKKAVKAPKAKQGPAKPDPDDPIDDILGGDSIPWK